MTDKRREQAARRFRQLLDQGELRKNAIVMVKGEYSISKASLYAYCRQFNVSTR